ncbi:MAG: class I tRNA ligase family protein, partial [Proteobacteria bacterium]|nr:class I tRNA ligase family protein [Pseudomonadota bacterium]
MILATPDGQDPWLSRNSFEIGRNFINKIYQVARFLKLRVPEDDSIDFSELPDRSKMSLPDKWILSKLERAVKNVNEAMDDYRLSAALKKLYEFLWNDYCSWYVELIKPDQSDQKIPRETLQVAFWTLDRSLALL